MKQTKTFRLGTLIFAVLASVLLLMLLGFFSLLVLTKNMFEENAVHTQQLISQNILTGGVPFALITDDIDTLKHIVDAQLEHVELYSIEIHDQQGKHYYKAEKKIAHSVKITPKSFPILDLRTTPILDKFSVTNRNPTKIGELTLLFTSQHTDQAISEVILAGIFIFLFALLSVSLIYVAFNSVIRKSIKNIEINMSQVQDNVVPVIPKNILIEEFRRIFKSIEQTATIISSRDSELQASVKELEIANEKSMAAVSFRDNLIKAVSHDIRTPVTVIDGLFRALKLSIMKSPNSDKRINDYLSACDGSITLLKNIIEELFDFRQFELSKLSNNPEATNIIQLANSFNLIYQSKTQETGLIFKVQSSNISQTLNLNIDKNKIIRIIENLIDNAYKFTVSGQIELSLSMKGSTLTLSVKDSGIGISRKNLNYIFERHVQLEKREHSAYQGRGLGLAYVKTLCESIGAAIHVDSAPGIGSKFSITIPAVDICSITEGTLKYPNMRHYSALIVDDNKAICNILEDLLQPYQIECNTENIPELGLQSIIQSPPDIVFVDFHMEGINGLELVNRATKTTNKKATIFIAMTADASVETAALLTENFSAVLSKPFSEVKIHEILSSLCSSTQIIEQLKQA